MDIVDKGEQSYFVHFLWCGKCVLVVSHLSLSLAMPSAIKRQIMTRGKADYQSHLDVELFSSGELLLQKLLELCLLQIVLGNVLRNVLIPLTHCGAVERETQGRKRHWQGRSTEGMFPAAELLGKCQVRNPSRLGRGGWQCMR